MPHVPRPKRHPYDQWSPDARALDLVGDKWTLLIVRDLAAGPRRFVELQRVLPGISTEQLRSRLNRMVADGTGTVQGIVEDGEQCSYAFALTADGVSVEEGATDGATARIAGTTQAWIDAFSPDRDRSGLEFGGKRELAEALLDGLSALNE